MITLVVLCVITALLTSLTPGQTDIERTENTISSLMDTWMVLANEPVGPRRRRGLYVLKSRGMAHSNEQREFAITDHGLNLLAAAGAAHGAASDVELASLNEDHHAVV